MSINQNYMPNPRVDISHLSIDVVRPNNNQGPHAKMKRPDASIGSPSEFSASVTMKSEGFESIMSKIQDEAVPEK